MGSYNLYMWVCSSLIGQVGSDQSEWCVGVGALFLTLYVNEGAVAARLGRCMGVSCVCVCCIGLLLSVCCGLPSVDYNCM